MLKLERLNKRIGGFSLQQIDLTVSPGDYFVLIGETGAGKSMLLEIITGLLTPDSGTVFLNGMDITKTPPQHRNFGIVYQKPSLFPHMSVYENIVYPLKRKKAGKQVIQEKLGKLAEELEITSLLKRNISNLSGGEAQRVTIARALITDPVLLLLDEPLSYLDIQLKREMSALLRKINQQGKTIIHVTHDYEEALSLTNKIGILENGTIIQTGSPQDVFNNPKSQFVANFIGIKNFFYGKISCFREDPSLKQFQTAGVQILLISEEQENSEGNIIIPGESITISEEELHSSAVNNFKGSIKDVFRTRLGQEVVIDIGIEIMALISCHSIGRLDIKVGKSVWISFKASSVKFFRSS